MGRFMFVLLASALVSEEELRFAPVYKQGYDTSCGISATASLLDMYWGVHISESQMYQDMIIDHLSDKDTDYTINMLTIIEYLEKHNIASRAYSMDWETLIDTLQKGYAPIIVHYAEPRPHFALLLGIEKSYALVADPAYGIHFVNFPVFTHNYSGNALLSASNIAEKKSGYIEDVVGRESRRLESLEKLATRRRGAIR
jgi:predicted double-glycine peptidase